MKALGPGSGGDEERFIGIYESFGARLGRARMAWYLWQRGSGRVGRGFVH